MPLNSSFLQHLDAKDSWILHHPLKVQDSMELGDIPNGVFTRVVTFSDIHGDLELLLNLLENTSRVISVNDATGEVTWVGGGRVAIVVVGDIVDRHREGLLSDTGEILHEEKYMLLLLRYVDILARAHESRVFKLVGNHEIMNAMGHFSNVSAMGFSSFDSREGRKQAFQKGGIMYEALKDSFAILRIGSLLFVHGGISPEIVKSVMQSVQDRSEEKNIHFNFVQFVNSLLREMFNTPPDEWKARFDPWFTQLFVDEQGILWNREFSKEDRKPSCERVQQTLDLMGYSSDKNMMFLLGHSGQAFRCFAELKQGVMCKRAGYTLADKIFENRRIQVLGGHFVHQKGMHGITFFCLEGEEKGTPRLCLLDISQSRAFDMPASDFKGEENWHERLKEARKPSLLDVRFRTVDNQSTPFYYIVRSKKPLSHRGG